MTNRSCGTVSGEIIPAIELDQKGGAYMKNRVKKMWLLGVYLCLAFCLPSTPIHAEKAFDKTLSPYFVVEGGGASADRFPLKETDVKVTINGVISDIRVTQVYANEGINPINARYVFPASTRASVHGMQMVIGEQVVTAKIREREAAKQEFQKAKEEGKSASLLEQQRPNVFTMRVANILPNDQVRIELHYTELLVPSEGTYEFVYPTVVGPRYSNQPEASAPEEDRWVKSPYLRQGSLPPTRFSISATLSMGLPLEEVLCESHKVTVKWASKSVAHVSLEDRNEFGGNRDFILHYRLAGREIHGGLMLYEGENENFFLLMVQPPGRVGPEEISPREYVFVLDVSGSMHGFPLDTAKTLVRDLISHLRPTDRFNVILFAGGSSIMAPFSVPATHENIQAALRVIEAQRGGGGTELAAALNRALSIPRDEGFSRTVLIVTDGLISAEKETFALIQENLGTTNFFSFGIGGSVNRYLIEGIAKAGLGEPFVVTGPEQAPMAANRFREYVQSPLLTNMKVAYRGFEAYDIEPPGLPDLFAQRPIILFGKYRGGVGGRIEVSGKTATGRYLQTFEVSETKPSEINSALRYLWARSKIARLSDFGFDRDNPGTKEEITSLGLTYSLLTQYTSFTAVLDVIRNNEGKSRDVSQPLPLPQHVSDLAVGGYQASPEPELILLFGLALLTSSVLLTRKMMKCRGNLSPASPCTTGCTGLRLSPQSTQGNRFLFVGRRFAGTGTKSRQSLSVCSVNSARDKYLILLRVFRVLCERCSIFWLRLRCAVYKWRFVRARKGRWER
jgi:Ca-activated chloride channel family protein